MRTSRRVAASSPSARTNTKSYATDEAHPWRPREDSVDASIRDPMGKTAARPSFVRQISGVVAVAEMQLDAVHFLAADDRDAACVASVRTRRSGADEIPTAPAQESALDSSWRSN